ncbi:MAG TPA: glycoside hydrolase family 47 protein [bacterium]|nr:glycoside hydrolase family 47 protein [bacterium]
MRSAALFCPVLRARFALLALILTLVIAPGCQRGPAPVDRAALAEEVKTEFLHAWQGYKAHAWGHDELLPLSAGYRDWHSVSLLMTPVDAYDTMLLMGLTAEAAEAKKLILDSLDFDHAITVKNFEITIRTLGGLLSAYQLDGDPRFLALAQELGDRLLPVFNSPTGMPYTFVNLKTGAVSGPVSNPAEIGTLLLEFGTLSKLTGQKRYYNKAKIALVQLFNRRSDLGLVGTTINVETGEWGDTSSHISGMIDSYYEYLFKSWKLFGDGDCKLMFDSSMVAVNRYLADEVEGCLWYGRADMNSGARGLRLFGSLDAFMPGLLIYAGDRSRAEKLQDSCYRLWMLHGIEPEMLDYGKMEVTAANYELRPENIESAWYLHRFTGEDKYLAMGRDYFVSLRTHCRTEHGYAALASVITKEKKDSQESFFLTETLKYLYLLFAPVEIDLDQTVFNTEAHPLKRTWPPDPVY